MEENLKYIILGYRKHTGKTQRELAKELAVPLDIVIALEMGTYKYPTERLMDKIEKEISKFDKNDLIHIGRGYKIHDDMGPYFKYYIEGLKKIKAIKPKELKELPTEECYKAIGSFDLNEFEVVQAGIEFKSK